MTEKERERIRAKILTAVEALTARGKVFIRGDALYREMREYFGSFSSAQVQRAAGMLAEEGGRLKRDKHQGFFLSGEALQK